MVLSSFVQGIFLVGNFVKIVTYFAEPAVDAKKAYRYMRIDMPDE
jgi:hypothetical protein